jgi:hypothetical protein
MALYDRLAQTTLDIESIDQIIEYLKIWKTSTGIHR